MLSKAWTRSQPSKIFPSNFPLWENIVSNIYLNSNYPGLGITHQNFLLQELRAQKTQGDYYSYIWLSQNGCSNTCFSLTNKFSFWWVFGEMVTLINIYNSLEAPQARYPSLTSLFQMWHHSGYWSTCRELAIELEGPQEGREIPLTYQLKFV